MSLERRHGTCIESRQLDTLETSKDFKDDADGESDAVARLLPNASGIIYQRGSRRQMNPWKRRHRQS